MRTKFLKLALALTLSASALSANAAPTTSVTINGNTFDVSTISTSWDVDSALIQSSSPWWGNGNPAVSGSNQLADTYFAYQFDSNSNSVFYFYNGGFNSPLAFGSPTISGSDIVKYAYVNSSPVTTPVPEADTSAMLLMGAGVMGFMARRRKNTQA
jgi:hypothetical protein